MKTLIKSLIAASLVVGSLSALEAKDTKSQTFTLDTKTITALKDMGFVYTPIETPVVTDNMLRRAYYSSSWTDIAGQEQSCIDSYGEDARVANWEDIEHYAQGGENITALVEGLLYDDRAEKLFINVDAQANGDNGKYIIQKGNLWIKTVTIDNVGKHKIDLKTFNPYSYYPSQNTFQDTLCYVPGSDVWQGSIVIRD